jgi:predicted NAD/FAD-binding protein
MNIAVVGSGIAGLSAAWLLAGRHDVTLFEAEGRLGGHSHTIEVAGTPIDTGFIVYNDATYPNLSALFRHLGVKTRSTDMSFAVSLDNGRLEYSGTGFRGLFAQRSNAFSPRFWRMLHDLFRFYRRAPLDAGNLGATSLSEYLDAAGYGDAFRDDHLFPMAAAIWSTPAADIGNYPAAAFIRFCETHGLLKLSGRPVWRTVAGGSCRYVERLVEAIPKVVCGYPVGAILRGPRGPTVVGPRGQRCSFDHVVIATQADQALQLLDDPSPDERRLLGAFSYVGNEAILHQDTALMPTLRSVWSSWNYMSCLERERKQLAVTYWMNRLQGIPDDSPYFVTLNPHRAIRAEAIVSRLYYRHPTFTAASMTAQHQLGILQGKRRTWFSGSYFGAGFHEDGLQAGLAVAEALGSVKRPWAVPNESGRICPVAPTALVGQGA